VNPMVFWIASVVGMAIAYLFGSTPTGYLAGKLLKGIDIREHGSKSTGATPRDRPHIRVTSCRR
jgi:glycerol-3-phosphate acyltransferase PlsY